MPWLDTSSQLWTNMQFTLEQDTLQQLKGQQLQLQETREGNRILQNGVANALTESLAPTLLNIEANTTDVTKLSSESQAIYQSYVDSGFSEQEALKATQHMIEIYQNPTKYLNGNASVSDILASQASLFGNSIVDIQKSQSDLYRVAGSAGRMSGFVTDAYGIPTGGQTRDAEIFNRISNAGELTEKYLEDFSISDINAQNKYNESVNNLPSKVTATQSVDNSMQNISAGVVSAFATIPHGLDTINLIYDTVDNIKKILIANYATDLMGRFFHSNRSGGGPLNGGSLGGNNVGENNGRLRNIISTQGNRLRNSLSRPEINLEELQAAEGLTGRVANTQLGEHLINFNNTSIGSVLSSPVAQFGGALAGGVVAYKGISDAKNYFNEDKNVRGTMSAISGTAGGVAAGALGASAIAGMAGATGAAALLGPIGWAALGIGAIGLGATKVVDHFTEITDASSTVTKNFKESAEAISKEYTERNNNIFAISEEIKNLDTTDEKLKYLQSQGLDPQIDLTKDVNGQLNEYLNSMMSANDALADEVQRISEDLQSKYKGEVNDQIEDVKKDLVEGYSKSALATKGYDKTRIENEQKRMLEAIGYSKEEIQAAFKHGINGALGEEELHDLLAWGQVKGKNLESFDDRFELDKVNTSGVRRMLSMSGSDIQFTDWNQVASESGQYMNAIAYLNKYKEYGKEKGKITDNIPAEFNQKEYDKYKKLILDAPEDHKKLINDIFVESYNNSEAMSDWPNSLKGYKLGSKYIGYDQLAMLHRGERVLTENENNFYTSQYTNLTEDISNLNKNMTNSSIIVSSAQDIISAINLQTKEIVNALKNQSISIDSNNLATSQMNNNIFNDSQLSPVSLLPSMSMTRVLE